MPTEVRWKLCEVPAGDQTDGLLLSYVVPSENVGTMSDYLEGVTYCFGILLTDFVFSPFFLITEV